MTEQKKPRAGGATELKEDQLEKASGGAEPVGGPRPARAGGDTRHERLIDLSGRRSAIAVPLPASPKSA